MDLIDLQAEAVKHGYTLVNQEYLHGMHQALITIAHYMDGVIEPQSLTVQWQNRAKWFDEVKKIAKDAVCESE